MTATLPPRDRRHGTITGYNNYRCRCDRCRRAASAYWKKRDKPRVRREPPGLDSERVDRLTPTPALSIPRSSVRYVCDCGAGFTDRAHMRQHTCPDEVTDQVLDGQPQPADLSQRS